MNKSLAFTEDNFRSVIQGDKTETRRLLTLKGLSQELVNEFKSIHKDGGGNWIAWTTDTPDLANFTKEAYPNGEVFKSRLQIGDRAYLKEPTQIVNAHDSLFYCDVKYFWHDDEVLRRFLTPKDKVNITERKTGIYSKQTAMFMLKSFARYRVEVVDVRVERLLDITAEGAIREGIKPPLGDAYTPPECLLWWDYMYEDYILPDPRTSYLSEIAYIHKQKGGWDLVKSNPWMWVYRFKLVENES